MAPEPTLAGAQPRRMHAGELETDAGLVRRLLAGQHPQWASLPLARVASSGTDNALYRLGGELVVRLPRIGWAVGDAERALAWLRRLAPRLPVAIAVPLALGEPAEGYPWPWSVYPWFEGESAEPGRLADPERLARELAGFVAALHALDPAGGPPHGRGGPLAERDEATRAALAQLHGMVDVTAATAAWDAALAAPPWDGPPVWLHGDLSGGNLVLHDGRLAAVIDLEGIGVGDPAVDLIAAWNLLPAHARPPYRAGVGVDEATWRRGRGWALSIALIQLPYYHETNRPLAANARHTICQVLSELR